MNLGFNRVNLIFRFILEVAALAAFGYGGWQSAAGWMRYLWAGIFPLLSALAWGLFAVPGDPSRSGKAPIPVPGWLRLLLELAIFGLAGWGLHRSGAAAAAWLLTVLVLLHYFLSADRIKWLFQRRAAGD